MIISVDVEVAGWENFAGLEDAARDAVAATLRAERRDGAVAVALLFTGDAAVAELNKVWRGKEGPTNVLSYPVEDFPVPPGEPKLLGDVVLAYDTCAREAAEQGKTLHDHTMHLIVHGILHLLGHDHIEADEADAMEDLECRILKELGISNPYE